jgi:hypothetical protein
MSKHTEGPWAIETNHVVAGAVRVAVVDTPNLHAGVDWVEADANARLIAAAPALLDALHSALASYRPSFVHPGMGRHDPTELPAPEWVLQARAAIAKATGGQP